MPRAARTSRGVEACVISAGNEIRLSTPPYRIVLVVPDKMAREKVLHCKAMGAEVVLTRSNVGRGHPDYYQDVAEDITARTPGALFINQFANPANPQAHEATTGPGNFSPDAGQHRCHCGGGRLWRYAERYRPFHGNALGSDAHDSPAGPDRLGACAVCVESGHVGKAGSWAVEGIGEDFIPPNADLQSCSQGLCDFRSGQFYRRAVTSFATRECLRGSSTGALLAAALRYCREQDELRRRVVSLVCDSRRKISVEGFQPGLCSSGRLGLTSATAKCAMSCSAAFPKE